MKKGTKLMTLLCIFSLLFTACTKDSTASTTGTTGSPDPTTNAAPETTTVAPVEDANTNVQVLDGITITITGCQINDYEDQNGQYDRMATMTYTIKNDSEAAFGYSPVGWSAKMADGFVLEPWIDIMKLDLTQVPAGSEKEADVNFLIENGVEVKEFTASYNFMDYSEEYWGDFGKIMTGEMGQQEYEKKYNDFTILDFAVNVK